MGNQTKTKIEAEETCKDNNAVGADQRLSVECMVIHQETYVDCPKMDTYWSEIPDDDACERDITEH